MLYLLDSDDGKPPPKFSWKKKSKLSELIITIDFLHAATRRFVFSFVQHFHSGPLQDS